MSPRCVAILATKHPWPNLSRGLGAKVVEHGSHDSPILLSNIAAFSPSCSHCGHRSAPRVFKTCVLGCAQGFWLHCVTAADHEQHVVLSAVLPEPICSDLPRFVPGESADPGCPIAPHAQIRGLYCASWQTLRASLHPLALTNASNYKASRP